MSDEQMQEQQVQLSLQDIAAVVEMIDVVSRRGAFAGNELAGIGMLRNKMEVFLRQNAPQDAAANEGGPEVPADAPLADKVQ